MSISLVQMLMPILASVCLAFSSRDANAANTRFIIAPYLFVGAAEKIQLAWQPERLLSSQAPQEVAIFDAKRPIAKVSAREQNGLWIADLPIPSCGFGKQISYRVTGMEGTNSIAPIPCANDPEITRFSFIADAQEGPNYVYDLIEQVRAFPGSFLLSAGDQVQHGSAFADWIDYFAAIGDVGSQRVTVSAIGNHEYWGKGEILWSRFFQTPSSRARFSVHLGPMHLIVLNSSFEDDPSQIEAQLPWLHRQLAVPAKWKAVMFHHPPFASTVFHIGAYPKKEYKPLREKYVPLFEAYGVDLVLSGHTHIYERSERNGVQYLIAGPSGGALGFPASTNSYSRIAKRTRTATHFELTSTHLRAVTVSIDGERLDSFSLNKRSKN